MLQLEFNQCWLILLAQVNEFLKKILENKNLFQILAW